MRRVLLAIVSTVAALVLLLSFKTHSTSALITTTPPAAVATTGTAKTPTSTTSTPSSTATKTYTGSAVDTRYGPVQVRITVKNGKVTSAEAIDYPNNDPRDAQINSYAIPALNDEAKSAGSASISMISGATYTSQGYISSLQSAIDQAGI
jgi:uncharacterized protein with FMN-binding domain